MKRAALQLRLDAAMVRNVKAKMEAADLRAENKRLRKIVRHCMNEMEHSAYPCDRDLAGECRDALARRKR